MTKNMLIDATHAEETRVVVLDGNRLEDYDVETSTKRQLKGNIYLAKVVRVEPSLQAAFVEYGGGRHGFLAFGEIHPDYYQIPVADRQRLLEMQAEEARREEEEEDRAAAAEEEDEAASQDRGGHRVHEIETAQAEPETIEHDPNQTAEGAETPLAATDDESDRDSYLDFGRDSDRAQPAAIVHEVISSEIEPEFGTENQPAAEFSFDAEPFPEAALQPPSAFQADEPTAFQSDEPETIEAESPKRASPRYLRSYKIQEVIKRRQILLIQVVKEERGTKGAALTTFISLAGRFCVLMPNSPRGGGISRKITSAADRRRLKEITAELAVPKGMGLIVRTAGAARPKPEIKRDCEYLMRLWDDIREHTMKSVAPAQIYEEASLIKRAIRDVYSRDIDEVIVDGEDGWRQAHEFMRMLMPSHAKKVRLWRDTPVANGGGGQPLFARYQVDVQLDAMMSPTVQLKSGGYLVINQAEALVAVDVNSGRSTRERGIEETALRTNLEAADEVARQLRLRDLAGLIVIDFIDMESKKNNAMVERRIKEALKNDRARIQIGQISHFGLLEMSRQRLRPSLTETSFITCAHCNGLGLVRSTESAAIQVLRTIEEEGGKRRSAEIVVYAASSIAMYIFNHKRERLSAIEQRYAMRVTFAPDESLLPPNVRIERLRALIASDYPTTVTPDAPPAMLAAPEPEIEEEDAVSFADERGSDARGDDEDNEISADSAAPRPGETAEESEQRGRRRRRRRRGGRREDGAVEAGGETEAGVTETGVTEAPEDAAGAAVERAVAIVAELPLDGETAPLPTEDEEAQRRRRGRRGGRRRKPAEDGPSAVSEPGAEQPDLPPVYAGPTPANPFGGHEFDIFDVLERAEEQAARNMGVTIAASSPLPERVPSVPEAGPVEVPQAVAVEVPQAVAVEVPQPVAVEVPEALAVEVPEALAVEVPEPVAIVLEPVVPAAGAEIIQPTPAEVEAEEISHHAADAAPVAEIAPPPIVETVIGPAIQPILIGSEASAPVEKKLGWWRR